MPRTGLSSLLVPVVLAFACIVAFPAVGSADSVLANSQVLEGTSSSEICSSGAGSISCSSTGSATAFGTNSAGAFASLSTGTMGTSVIASEFGNDDQQDYAKDYATAVMIYDFHLPTSLDGNTLLFNVSISGTNLSSCSGVCSSNPVSSQFSAPLNSEHIVGDSGTGLALPSGTTNVNITTPITNGLGELELELTSNLYCFIDQRSVCNASSDFSDPLTITGAEILDSAGNVVQGVPIVSESGFNPNASSVPVNTPESSSISMLAIGLLAVAVLAARRGKGVQVTMAKA